MHRLFFALWPDNPTREAIAGVAARLRTAHPSRARAVRDDRLHLTLRFLGDVPAPRTAELDALRALAARVHVERPRFVLDRAGDFHRGRVWWLGSSTPVDALARLHAALRPADAPVPSREDFVPHVTIARDAGVALSEPVPPIGWAPAEFVLVDSVPGEGYRLLGRWPLLD